MSNKEDDQVRIILEITSNGKVVTLDSGKAIVENNFLLHKVIKVLLYKLLLQVKQPQQLHKRD
jgi:hypothetical protein